jgi:hypothetical protein
VPKIATLHKSKHNEFPFVAVEFHGQRYTLDLEKQQNTPGMKRCAERYRRGKKEKQKIFYNIFPIILV